MVCWLILRQPPFEAGESEKGFRDAVVLETFCHDVLPLNALDIEYSLLPRGDGHASRFTEEQIIKVLKEHSAGLSAGELCRKYGVSDATFYKWRSRYGGMEISDARKLKALEDENRRLKKLLAELLLDASTLKEMLGKNF